MSKEEICYEFMKDNNNVDSDGGCYGKSNSRTHYFHFECNNCYHFNENRKVNLEGKYE